MYYSVRQTKDVNLIRKLHAKCFPGEEFYKHEKNKYWVVMDRNGVSLGFGIATDFGDGVCFLSRAGVLAKHRGHGIHRRLIKVRLSYAKKFGFGNVITYTTRTNHASINNLIACGFKSYTPAKEYVGKGFNYWILSIQ